MFLNLCISILIVAAVILILWLLRGVMLMPVKCEKMQRLTVVLSVAGPDPGLENTVDGILWLIQNGTLPAEIVIEDAGMDADTRRTAEALTRDYAITLREKRV